MMIEIWWTNIEICVTWGGRVVGHMESKLMTSTNKDLDWQLGSVSNFPNEWMN